MAVGGAIVLAGHGDAVALFRRVAIAGRCIAGQAGRTEHEQAADGARDDECPAVDRLHRVSLLHSCLQAGVGETHRGDLYGDRGPVHAQCGRDYSTSTYTTGIFFRLA